MYVQAEKFSPKTVGQLINLLTGKCGEQRNQTVLLVQFQTNVNAWAFRTVTERLLQARVRFSRWRAVNARVSASYRLRVALTALARWLPNLL